MPQSDRAAVRRRSSTRVSDAMAERRQAGRAHELKLWLLVDVHRWAVVAALAAGVFATTLLLGLFGPVTARQFLLEGTLAATAYIEMQPGVITAMTVVLAINQLILSPDLGPVSRSRQRLEDTLDHREAIANLSGRAATPTEPVRFLQVVADAVHERATRLEQTVGDADDPELRRRVSEFVAQTTEEAELVSEVLEGRRFRDVDVLGAAMHFDTDTDLFQANYLRSAHGESLSPAQEKAVSDVVDALELFTTTREYFRTLYVRSEFVSFSRAMLFTGLPALLTAHYAVEIIGGNAFPDATLGVPNLLLFEAGAFTVTVLPVLVLVSYVARLATLAETSAFTGPFQPQSTGNAAQESGG